MDVDVAAEVLAGSILTGLAFIVAVITIVIINNIFHKYWKTVNLWKFEQYPTRFVEPGELDNVKKDPAGPEVKSP
jgi:hypothetical protein